MSLYSQIVRASAAKAVDVSVGSMDYDAVNQVVWAHVKNPFALSTLMIELILTGACLVTDYGLADDFSNWGYFYTAGAINQSTVVNVQGYTPKVVRIMPRQWVSKLNSTLNFEHAFLEDWLIDRQDFYIAISVSDYTKIDFTTSKIIFMEV